MKIGILGYGKMGKAVERLSHDLGHETSIGLDSTIDVVIDFTEPLAVKETAKALSKTQTVGEFINFDAWSSAFWINFLNSEPGVAGTNRTASTSLCFLSFSPSLDVSLSS